MQHGQHPATSAQPYTGTVWGLQTPVADASHDHHRVLFVHPQNWGEQHQGHHQHQLRPVDQHARPLSPAKLQQAQQWVHQEGLEDGIADLVAHVGAVSAVNAKHAALQAQQSQQLQQQLQASLQMQQALQQQLQEQAQKLLAQQQELELLRPAANSQYSHLYTRLDQLGKELAVWRSKCQNEQHCRDIAESALKETLVIMDQLTEECAAVSSMLKDLQRVEAAAAANSAPGTQKQAVKWLSIEVAAAALLIICTAAATFLITRAVLRR